MLTVTAPHRHSEAVASRLALARQRLQAERADATSSPDAAAESLRPAEALMRLREACDGLAATELEVRRARSELGRLAARAAAWRSPPDAA
jgi:hypothetical protein